MIFTKQADLCTLVIHGQQAAVAVKDAAADGVIFGNARMAVQRKEPLLLHALRCCVQQLAHIKIEQTACIRMQKSNGLRPCFALICRSAELPVDAVHARKQPQFAACCVVRKLRIGGAPIVGKLALSAKGEKIIWPLRYAVDQRTICAVTCVGNHNGAIVHHTDGRRVVFVGIVAVETAQAYVAAW